MHLQSAPLKPVPPNTLLYTILIPAYNESDNIRPTLQGVARVLRAESIPFEIVVVNDNSSDLTPHLVQELHNTEIPEARLVNNTGPGGFGRAVRCGLDNVEGEVVALVMADLSDSPEDIVQCYRKIEEGYDCVFGSRFLPGSKVAHYPPLKLYINRIVNKMLQLLFVTEHNDLTNAFKVYRRHVLESIKPLRAAHFNITIELSLSTLIRHYRIARVPISWSGRTWGQSNMKLKLMGRRYLCTMLMIWFERLLVLDDLLLEQAAKQRKG
jgi:dolichol-phosphate mannosyltransferase